METELPRILNPNLGCPFILSLEDLQSEGFEVVIAAEEKIPYRHLLASAQPSFPGEGREFIVDLENPQELTEGTLPLKFKAADETRWLISTTLHSFIFEGRARFFRYRARLRSSPGRDVYRKKGSEPVSTLYDLHLMEGEKDTGTVFHALCLRPQREGLRFIHLTDLHIALRNDLYGDNLRENVTFPPHHDPSKIHYNNFNENLRRFIAYANSLADQGKLDLVLILGDLIDFLGHGFQEREYSGTHNYRVFRELILGMDKERERDRPNVGLKVPIFTSTGNHDWRLFPYDPAVHYSVFGVNKEVAKQFDLFWADTQEEISQKIESTYARLIREGSPISNRTWMGKLINQGLQRLEKWQVQLLTPLSASALMGILPKIPWIGGPLHDLLGRYDPLLTSLIVLLLLPAVMGILTGFVKKYIRSAIPNLLAIEAGWQALKDYFLTINPFFNYAFRVGSHYFLVLDTGHDCMRAQYLWDDGDKKMGPLSLLDNTIGQSPDSMAFYDINEYYPYSQIGWIERVMALIQEETKEKDRPSRIFVGLHAPPANLSREQARKAQKEARDHPEGILLGEGEYNIRFGSINHYLSHFYHLCLGKTESSPEEKRYPLVDMVLAGHAHWKLEFRLAWDEKKKGPIVYFGDFTANPDFFREDFEKLRPLLFQSPACGPRENFSPDPPYFRYLEVDGQGRVSRAEVQRLKEDGSPEVAKFPPY
jgi:hypothetical protein